MDHGKLTDHNGKTVDFRNVVLIMTSNAGASDLARAPIGFNRAKREGDDEEAINRLFTPEFRNRLDAVVSFAPLPQEVISQIVDKFVFQLEAQLGERNATIELTEEARAWLATQGYDEKFGARPLSRVIQEHIKKPLAEELLFGKLQNGGTVRVLLSRDGEKEKLAFEFDKPKTRPEAVSEDEEETETAPPEPPRRKLGRAESKKEKAGDKGRDSSPVPKVPLSDK
jgi:ATP-dependent Clp protease ATP-binding subunit ClpA